MEPYMTGLISQEDLFLFQKIEKVVHEMPEVDLGVDQLGDRMLISCHMVSRALAHLFPEVEWKDGYFARFGQRHSWLKIKRSPNLTIDPYPVALVGGPIMVHGGFITTPWDKLYIEAKLADLGGLVFRKCVRTVEQAMLTVAVR